MKVIKKTQNIVLFDFEFWIILFGMCISNLISWAVGAKLIESLLWSVLVFVLFIIVIACAMSLNRQSGEEIEYEED